MKSILTIAALAAAALMTGCGVTLSVNPLYTEKDQASDLELEGRWTDDEAKDIWDVRKEEQRYLATCITDRDVEAIEIRVVRLGEDRFLDLTSKNTPSLAVPGHLFAKARMSGEELQLQVMNQKWVEKKVREAGFPYVETGGGLLLTGSTAALQKFVLLHAGEAEAFEEAERLHRVR